MTSSMPGPPGTQVVPDRPIARSDPGRALLPENIHPAAGDALTEAGYEVEQVDHVIDEQ